MEKDLDQDLKYAATGVCDYHCYNAAHMNDCDLHI
jgi:hypothetical protein